MRMKVSSSIIGMPKEKGFSVRKNFARSDPMTTVVTSRQYKCFREGYRKDVYMTVSIKSREPRALTRYGCNAPSEIKLDKEKGDWCVVNYVTKNNYPLARTDEVAFVPSHRTISNAQKANMIESKEVGLHQHQVMDVKKRHDGGFEVTMFVSKDMYNYFVRQKKKMYFSW